MNHKPKIVCIDDDPLYTKLYTDILTTKGYYVFQANNPSDGFEVVKKEKPALILLDVMMPEHGRFSDGFSLLEALKKNEETKNIPVIIISGLGSGDDVHHGLFLGAAAYLPKQGMIHTNLVKEIEKQFEKKNC